MKYTGHYVEWDRDYHCISSRDYTKQFNSVQDALKFQYDHKTKGFDYMIQKVVDNTTGKEVKVWEHITPKTPNVEL